MKKYVTRILALLAVVVILAAIVVKFKPFQHKKAAINKQEVSTSPLIKTNRPGRRNFSLHLQWFGRVESKSSISITPLTNGKITAVKAIDGTVVKQGDVLFALGGPQVSHEVAILSQRKTALEKQVSLSRSIVELRRNAVAEKMGKREALLAAKEHLTQLSSELAAVRQKSAALEDTLLIRSPMDGIFTNRLVTIGQEVGKGMSLGNVLSHDLHIIARLFPPDGIALRGKRAIVQAASGVESTGTVSNILPQQSTEGATIVWIDGEDINQRLKPGESVSGWIVLENRNQVLAVPREAVVRDQQEHHTFVLLKAAQGYRQKAVKLGLADDGWVEIVSGLSGNEEVVVRGAYELFNRNFTKTYKVLD